MKETYEIVAAQALSSPPGTQAASSKLRYSAEGYQAVFWFGAFLFFMSACTVDFVYRMQVKEYKDKMDSNLSGESCPLRGINKQ